MQQSHNQPATKETTQLGLIGTGVAPADVYSSRDTIVCKLAATVKDRALKKAIVLPGQKNVTIIMGDLVILREVGSIGILSFPCLVQACPLDRNLK